MGKNGAVATAISWVAHAFTFKADSVHRASVRARDAFVTILRRVPGITEASTKLTGALVAAVVDTVDGNVTRVAMESRVTETMARRAFAMDAAVTDEHAATVITKETWMAMALSAITDSLSRATVRAFEGLGTIVSSIS